MMIKMKTCDSQNVILIFNTLLHIFALLYLGEEEDRHPTSRGTEDGVDDRQGDHPTIPLIWNGGLGPTVEGEESKNEDERNIAIANKASNKDAKRDLADDDDPKAHANESTLENHCKKNYQVKYQNYQSKLDVHLGNS